MTGFFLQGVGPCPSLCAASLPVAQIHTLSRVGWVFFYLIKVHAPSILKFQCGSVLLCVVWALLLPAAHPSSPFRCCVLLPSCTLLWVRNLSALIVTLIVTVITPHDLHYVRQHSHPHSCAVLPLCLCLTECPSCALPQTPNECISWKLCNIQCMVPLTMRDTC